MLSKWEGIGGMVYGKQGRQRPRRIILRAGTVGTRKYLDAADYKIPEN